jgi:hypothetical protein
MWSIIDLLRATQRSLAAALENPQETDSNRLWRLGQSLAAVCTLLPSAHRTNLLALSNVLLQPASKKVAEGKKQPYDRQLLAEVCAQLRTEELAEVLKYPFCTDEAEQIVLEQLKAKAQLDFGGNVWKFVEQADSLGVKDIGSPAKRPLATDAVEELNALQRSVSAVPSRIIWHRILRAGISDPAHPMRFDPCNLVAIAGTPRATGAAC